MNRKKSDRELSFDSYFGKSKRYHFFLIKSPLDFYPFALLLNRHLHCSLAYRGSFCPEKELNAVFSFLSSPIVGINQGNIAVIENKTTNYNSGFLNKSKNEAKLNFQTLTLFKEYFYLLGNSSSVFLKFPNKMEKPVKELYDYIMIISHEKEDESIEDFLTTLKTHTSYSIFDLTKDIRSYIMNDNQEKTDSSENIKPKKTRKKSKRDAIDYLLELCQIVEIVGTEFEEEYAKKLLGRVKKIPDKNLIFKFQCDLPLQLENKYLTLLSKDITFE